MPAAVAVDSLGPPVPSNELADVMLRLGQDLTLSRPVLVEGLRLSSDTIATSHAGYRRRGMDVLWKALPAQDGRRHDRGFDTIGGFIVFPRRTASLNQRVALVTRSTTGLTSPSSAFAAVTWA